MESLRFGYQNMFCVLSTEQNKVTQLTLDSWYPKNVLQSAHDSCLEWSH